MIATYSLQRVVVRLKVHAPILYLHEGELHEAEEERVPQTLHRIVHIDVVPPVPEQGHGPDVEPEPFRLTRLQRLTVH